MLTVNSIVQEYKTFSSSEFKFLNNYRVTKYVQDPLGRKINYLESLGKINNSLCYICYF